ncbi:protein SPT2 homolog [Melanotaenia boesemani]|uniref:protein SPT2 homolog n=1 Tax=Melanotaenia boesemani TaxID=1250792 RepID=UPI001C0559BF|nr:protein SPT2 homolog [Melanotaenia boesemani]
MMDFDNILDIASQNQGLSNVQKRYSLQAGPPKKDPKSKGVNPSAIQALLKKQYMDNTKKEIQKKKEKDALLAKRVELKSDRKARAMASRTKDNFKGYNGIPVVEVPKKRGQKLDMQQSSSKDTERFNYNSYDPLDDEDNYEYEQTDSEPEEEPEPSRPGRTTGTSGSNSSSKLLSKKHSGPPKSAPSPLNFADLLKLAEKKQFEPVELKPKVVKNEERLRTADEIRELEMERKAKRTDKNRDSKTTKERDSKPQSSSSLVRKSALEKEKKQCKPQKNFLENPSGLGKKSLSTLTSDRGLSSSKSSVSDRERDRIRVTHSNREISNMSLSNTSGAVLNKFHSKATSSQVPAKQGGPRPSSSHKSSASSDLSFRKESSSSLQKGTSSNPGNRPSTTAATSQKSQHRNSQQTRPSQGSSFKQGPTVGSMKSSKGESLRPGFNSTGKSSGNPAMRPSSGGPPKAGNQPQGRPLGVPQKRPVNMPQVRPGGSGLQGHPGGGGSRPSGAGPGRPCSGGPVPGRPAGNFGSGPGRPKCTVVSETISSKNVGGPRLGVPPRPGMQQRPGMGPRPGMPPRPMMNRPPGPMLPPITSSYKRKYEDEEEYDSEMEDFIDEEGDEQEEISRHIKEIFGYDRNKYKDESDYALKFMESSWKDLQKEESRSLRLAVQEDLEEERREQEDLKRQSAKRRKH